MSFPTNNIPRQWTPAPRLTGRQRGFLLVTAVVLIVVVALILCVVVYLSAADTRSSGKFLAAKQALFIAGSGLERGTRFLVSPVLAERLACAAVTGNANLTSVAFAQGQFTVTAGNAGASYYPVTTLRLALGSADNTVPVTSLAGLAPAGRVLIDRESIDYSETEPVNDAVCGGAGRAPCLVGAQRGRDGGVAAAHAAGAPVGQYQCDLQSQGGVPDLANARGKRLVQKSVQLQEGWIVGDRINGGTSGWRFLRWNGTGSPNAWAAQTVTTVGTGAQSLRAISMLNYADGWAIGNSAGGGANQWTFLRWNAASNTWASIPVNTPGTGAQNLNGISMLSATDGWAVGVRIGGGANQWTFLRWNNPVVNTWNRITVNTPGTSAQNLNAVHLLSTTEGWAVGNAGGGGGGCTNNARILRWFTGAWNCVASPSNQNLNAVYALASNDAWAVGNRGGGGGGACTNNRARIVHWNGAAWSCVASPTASHLYALDMISSTDGWAVGQRLGAGTNAWNLVRWNGTTWSAVAVNTPGTGAQDLYAIDCVTTNDCWTTGNAGIVLHWDGAAWSRVNVAGVVQVLRGVALISHRQRPQMAWREIFP